MTVRIKLPPADCFKYPNSGYSRKSNDHYKELRANPEVWRQYRKKLLIRQDFKCAYCLCDMHDKRMNVEHIIPISRGGTNSKDNLCAACSQCNKAKGGKQLSKKETEELRARLKKLQKQSRKSTKRFYETEIAYQTQLGNELRRMFY